eukprot:gene12373-8499_t
MPVAPGIKGQLGSFLLRRSANYKTVRQAHGTGPQYGKRKHFPAFHRKLKGIHQLHFRGQHPQHIHSSPTHQPEWKRFSSSAGDVRSQPAFDYSFGWKDVEADERRRTLARGGHSSKQTRDEGLSISSSVKEEEKDLPHQRPSRRGPSHPVVDPMRRKVAKVGRVDDVQYAWEKKGDLQLFYVARTNTGRIKQVFVCFHCGYPVRSALVAVHRDNWDYRMCYSCYQKVVRHGMEQHL